MLTFKKSAPTPAPQKPDLKVAFRRCAGLILEGVGLHALAIEGVGQEAFLNRMRSAEQEISRATSESEILVSTGEAIKALAVYNQQIELQLAKKRKEVREIVVFLISTIRQTCNFNEHLLAALDELEQSFSEHETTDNLKSMKVRLEHRLEAAREPDPAFFEKTDEDSNPGNDGIQSVTGLAGRALAKQALAPGGDRRGIYAVALRVNSLGMIRTRYGVEASQQYLVAASQLLVQQLREDDRLFHWSDTILLAVIHRRAPEESVRREMNRVASTNREHTLQVDGRWVMCGIPISATVMSLASHPDPTILADRLDQFALHGSVEAHTA